MPNYQYLTELEITGSIGKRSRLRKYSQWPYLRGGQMKKSDFLEPLALVLKLRYLKTRPINRARAQ